MPREAIAADLGGRRIDWPVMLEMKKRWQVSIAALLYRARDLELLTPTAYESAIKQMSRRGWRRQEPGDLGQPEMPALLREAVKLLGEAGIALDHLAAELHLGSGYVAALIGQQEPERPVVTV